MGQQQTVEEAPVPEGSPQLTVATYNINWGGCYGGPTAAAPSVVQAILNTKADLVLLQEVTGEWQDYLSSHREITEEYPFLGFQLDERWMGGGDAVLSKYPFEEIEWVPADSGWFCGWVLKVLWPVDNHSKPIYVLNTHLRPPLSPTSPLYGLSVSAWFESKEDRKNDCIKFYQVLLDAIKKEDESHDGEEREEPFIIVAGDFNEEESGLAYTYFESEAQLKEARKEFDGQVETWFWPVLGVFTYKAKYDHIFYSPSSFRCLTAEVRKEGASDHYPVVATLIPRPKEEEEKKEVEEAEERNVLEATETVNNKRRRLGS